MVSSERCLRDACAPGCECIAHGLVYTDRMSDNNQNKQNIFRRQFDDAQRQRLDVEGFWESSKGAITGVVVVGLILVAGIALTVLQVVGV